MTSPSIPDTVRQAFIAAYAPEGNIDAGLAAALPLLADATEFWVLGENKRLAEHIEKLLAVARVVKRVSDDNDDVANAPDSTWERKTWKAFEKGNVPEDAPEYIARYKAQWEILKPLREALVDPVVAELIDADKNQG